MPPLSAPEAWTPILLGWVATLLAFSVALVSAYVQLRKLATDLNGVGAKVDRHATALAITAATAPAAGRSASSPSPRRRRRRRRPRPAAVLCSRCGAGVVESDT